MIHLTGWVPHLCLALSSRQSLVLFLDFFCPSFMRACRLWSPTPRVMAQWLDRQQTKLTSQVRKVPRNLVRLSFWSDAFSISSKYKCRLCGCRPHLLPIIRVLARLVIKRLRGCESYRTFGFFLVISF